MNSMIKKVDWSTKKRRALSATEIVSALAKLDGWSLRGEGDTLAIAKAFSFANYYQTMAFVNAVAFVAHVSDHHPTLSVSFNQCVVEFNTHDVHGISTTDIDCANSVDGLLL
jgi:4a-hydroxytetrahydrobiopterin dehydratase